MMTVDTNAEGIVNVVDTLIVLDIRLAMVSVIEGGINISCGYNNVDQLPRSSVQQSREHIHL